MKCRYSSSSDHVPELDDRRCRDPRSRPSPPRAEVSDPLKGDVILRGSVADGLIVLDAMSRRRATGPLPLIKALDTSGRRVG